MAKVTDEAIQISIPFAVPLLGLHEPTTISVDRSILQTVVRVIVVICAALLFWPRVKTAFGFSNTVTEDQTKDIQERIAKLEHERGQRQDQKGQKNYAVATGPGTTSTESTTSTAKDKGSAKRRKA